MGKLNSRSSYQGSRLLENLEVGLEKFDKSIKEGAINIKSPFNKFYRVGTPEEIAELEGYTVEEFKEFENEDPCREHFNIVGYAIAKDEYTDQISNASGLIYVEITDDGRLVYNVGERVFDLELSDLGLDVEDESEDLKEDSSFEAFMNTIEKADMNMITKSLYKISEWLKDYSNSCPEDGDKSFYLGCAGSVEEVSTDIENRYFNSEDEDV